MAGLVTSWEAHAGAACSWMTAPHGSDPRWSWGRARGGRSSKDSDELTASPIPHPLCCSVGKEVEELEMGVRDGQGVF